MSKVAKLLALSVLLAGCDGIYHKHDAMMESNHPHKHHKHEAKGGGNIENQVTKNVINHSNNVAKDAANTASAVTTTANSIK